MEKKKILIEPAVMVSGLAITPIIQTSVFGWQNRGGLSFFSIKQPLYVLIKNQETPVKAFTINGEAVSAQQIILDHPELAEAINRIAGVNGV